MSEFVEECRREWRRLGVPEPIANEMAADLTADLEEAAAEGGTPEDVLGNSAFDPRRLAASWAVARGVTAPAPPERSSLRRTTGAIVATALLGVLTVGASLVVLVGVRGRSFAFAVHRAVAVPGPIRVVPAGPNRFLVPGPLGAFAGAASVGVPTLALLGVIVGVAGLALVAIWCWSPWSGPRRHRRDGSPPTPGWN